MRPFKENSLSPAHLPTWMLIIGLPIYWLEVFFHPHNQGISTPTAWMIFVFLAIAVLRRALAQNNFQRQSWPKSLVDRVLIAGGIILCVGLIFVYFKAAILPPHLPQEEDVLNYHYTFPRQHLVRNSFNYIHWSTCDLFPYPVQFGLAPFWFATEYPNKFPQFIFFLAVPFILIRIMSILGVDDFKKKLLLVFAFFGAHHVMIQGGTAMLDVVLAYLILAALDSLLRGDWVFAAIEFTFYFWAKSFSSLQMTAVLIAVVIALVILRKFGFRIMWGFSETKEFLKIAPRVWRNFSLLFLVLSIFISGPFIWKSMRISGSPLFPFFVGVFPHSPPDDLPWDWESFVAAAKYDLSMKDAYGLARTPLNFLKHFWLVAVPQEGVNNVFDYPLGLTYLLCLGPFLWFGFKGLFKKEIGILPLLAGVIWMSWWFGSQQTRFLYVPLFLLYLTVIMELKFFRIFLLSILFALTMTAASGYRAHRYDFGKPVEEILRPRDKKFVELSQQYTAEGRSGIFVVDDYQAAYAQFPARVLEENIPYTLLLKRFR